MDEAQDIDRRIVGDYHTNPWIVAAAHAGDTRAMLFVADRVSYRAVAPGDAPAEEAADAATRRERARWYRQAAQHGSTEAFGKLAEFIRIDHQKWHQRRKAREYHGKVTIPGPEDLELCQAGASRGDRDCMQVWAEHLRTMKPGHQAEARHSQGQAKQEEGPHPRDIDEIVDEILDEIDDVLEEDAEEFLRRSYTQASGGVVQIVVTAVATAGLMPFIQAMISKAGQDTYDGLRKYLRNLFAHNTDRWCKPDKEEQLLIIEPPEQDGAVLQIWTDLPDEAITALSQLLDDMRTGPRRPGPGQRWYWNDAAHRWQALLAVPARPREPASSQPDGLGAGQCWYRWDVTAHRWQLLQVFRPSQQPAETASSEPDET